jgi:hypothetical protein
MQPCVSPGRHGPRAMLLHALKCAVA